MEIVPVNARAQAVATTETSVDPPVPLVEAHRLKHILLVDDEAHVLRVLRLILDRNGYEVDTALDGEVALRMVRERRYHALIVGAEFAREGGGLYESVRRLFGEDAPLMLVMDEDEAGSGVSYPTGVERLERPVSLRWIVARLNEYFGDYEVR